MGTDTFVKPHNRFASDQAAPQPFAKETITRLPASEIPPTLSRRELMFGEDSPREHVEQKPTQEWRETAYLVLSHARSADKLQVIKDVLGLKLKIEDADKATGVLTLSGSSLQIDLLAERWDDCYFRRHNRYWAKDKE